MTQLRLDASRRANDSVPSGDDMPTLRRATRERRTSRFAQRRIGWPALCAALLSFSATTPIVSAQTPTPTPTPSSSQGAPAAASAWKLDAAEHPLAAGATVRETVWSSGRPPGGAFDRIGLHRYRAQVAPIATLLYLPGTNMNGIAALTDEAHNLWVFLAARGVEVFAVDYRTRFIPVATPAASLTALRGWTAEAFVDDIRAAAEQARRESGRDRLFVAGFSRGVPLAYAYASTELERTAGLVLLDGSFKNHAPKGDFDAAAALAKLEASGAWASDVAGQLGWDTRQKLMDAVSANPAAPATDAKFKTLGDQLANILQFAWRPGGLANPLGGLSRPQVLATLLAHYDRYYPAVQDVDGKSIADHADDPRTALDDRWGKLKTPVLLFASTGMGGDWLLNAIYSADKSGSSDVTLNVLERYGHLDVIVGEQAQHDVYEPTLQWLRAHAGAGSTSP
jgi:pimeloyl-ACP methyl ester carboxylesterase